MLYLCFVGQVKTVPQIRERRLHDTNGLQRIAFLVIPKMC
ncbi:uncharacterized protein METZ01_LOCUS248700, partial [marine metagenome]